MYFFDIMYETSIVLQILHHTLVQSSECAVLKHSGFPRSRCFQIENSGSKLEENIGMNQITEFFKISFVYYHVHFFDFCSHVWSRNANKKKSAENFPCGLLKAIGFKGELAIMQGEKAAKNS